MHVSYASFFHSQIGHVEISIILTEIQKAGRTYSRIKQDSKQSKTVRGSVGHLQVQSGSFQGVGDVIYLE